MPTDYEDLAELLKDWRQNLYARNRAPRTVIDYLASGEMFYEWLVEKGHPTNATTIDHKRIEGYLVDLANRKQLRYTWKPVSPAYVAKNYRNLQQLFNYLVREEIIETSPFVKLRPPAVPEKPVPIMKTDEVAKLLDACKGSEFLERRDLAIMRTLLDTGCRVSELTSMELEKVDFTSRTVPVHGKGRRSRMAVFGPKTAEGIRRYLRVRSRHPRASEAALWIAEKGALTHHGVRDMLTRRAAAAGVTGVHPHRFRHQMAHDWKLAGGGEVDLMRLAGWRSAQMVARYGASAADAVAYEAHRRVNVSEKY